MKKREAVTVAQRLADLEAQRIEELRWIDQHGASADSTKRLDEIHYHIHLVRKDAKGA